MFLLHNALVARGPVGGSDVGSQVLLFVTGCVLCGLNKHCSLLESSILSFQGRCLIIDLRKGRRYGYRWADGHRGAGGDSWEDPRRNSGPGQTVRSHARGHLKKSHSCRESKTGPGADACVPGQVLQLSFNYLGGRHLPPRRLPPPLIHWNHSL